MSHLKIVLERNWTGTHIESSCYGAEVFRYEILKYVLHEFGFENLESYKMYADKYKSVEPSLSIKHDGKFELEATTADDIIILSSFHCSEDPAMKCFVLNNVISLLGIFNNEAFDNYITRDVKYSEVHLEFSKGTLTDSYVSFNCSDDVKYEMLRCSMIVLGFYSLDDVLKIKDCSYRKVPFSGSFAMAECDGQFITHNTLDLPYSRNKFKIVMQHVFHEFGMDDIEEFYKFVEYLK